MTILDRYVARQFLFNTVALFVILMSFIVAIDATLNLDQFLKIADDLASARGETPTGLRRGIIAALLIADLWWPRLLQLFNFLLGLVMVAAMGFTCAQMVRHREIVALLASGQSLRRIARPVLIVALGLTVVQVVNQEVVIPRIAPLLARSHDQAATRTLGAKSVLMAADARGRLFTAARFDAATDTLTDLHVLERSETGLMTRRIHAASARWRDGGWDLHDAWAEPINPAGGPSTRSPIDRLETDLDPTALKIRQYAGYSQSLSFAQVGQLIHAIASRHIADADPKARARLDRLERIRWGRFAVIASNILGLIIALPFFLTREPRNMVAQALKCTPVAGGAIMGGILASSMPLPGVPAAIGVFAPVAILIPSAIGFTLMVRS